MLPGDFFPVSRSAGSLVDSWCIELVFFSLFNYKIQRKTVVIALVLVIGAIVLLKKKKEFYL